MESNPPQAKYRPSADLRAAGIRRNTAVAGSEFGAQPIEHDPIDHGAAKIVTMINDCLC